MKKNSFVEGTISASFALIVIKILGALYVIPFYSIVGELGGALYSYAYNVYSLILNICTAGIPIAISKIISEYNTLEMYEAKERTLKIGNKIVMVVSSILFFATFIFSKEIGYLIIGDITGGNTLEDVSLVIKSISFCLLIVPLLAVKKGYLQGHKFITPTTNSQLIEQVVRIAIILFGSYLAINVFNLSVSSGVAIALLGAFFAGLSAYLYLELKIKKNKELFNRNTKRDKVSDKAILKKIITFSLPLIILSIAVDLYNMTDLALIIRGLSILGYKGAEAETIASVMSTWAPKICLIVNAIATGLSISLIPHMVSKLVKKDYDGVNSEFNRAISIIIVIGLPMSIGICLLSKEIYYLFYGLSNYGPIVLRILPFAIFATNINYVANMALQSINKFKTVYLSTIIGLVVNAILDIPLMLLFDKIGIYSYYGATVSTMIGVSISIYISFRSLKKEMNFNYKQILINIKKIILPTLLLILVVYILEYLLFPYFNTRLGYLIPCSICALCGMIVYFYTSYKNGLLNETLGKEYVDKILKKIKIKR